MFEYIRNQFNPDVGGSLAQRFWSGGGNKYSRNASQNLVNIQKFLESPTSRVDLPEFSEQSILKSGRGGRIAKIVANMLSGAGESIITEPTKIIGDVTRAGVQGIRDKSTRNFKPSSGSVRLGQSAVNQFTGGPSPFDTIGYYGMRDNDLFGFPIKTPEFGISESTGARMFKEATTAFEPVFAAKGITSPFATKGIFNPTALMLYLGLGGAFNLPFGEGSLEDRFAIGANRMAGKAPVMAGFNSTTNPIIETIKGPWWKKLPYKSFANVLEGIGLDNVSGFETTPSSIMVDAMFPVAQEVGGKIYDSLKEAVRGTEAKILQSAGKRLRNNKGAYTTVEKFIKNTRPYFKRNKDYWAGALFGFEPYQDEDGNWRVRFDEGKAFIGIALMAAGPKVMDQLDEALKQEAGEGIEKAGKESIESLADARKSAFGDELIPDMQKIVSDAPEEVLEQARKFGADIPKGVDIPNKTWYHSTTPENAKAINKEGFKRITKKGVENIPTEQPIFLSSKNNNAFGNTAIETNIKPTAKIFDGKEIYDEGFDGSKTFIDIENFAKKQGLNDQDAYDFTKDIFNFRDGNWDVREDSIFQKWLKSKGYDGFTTVENGVENLGIINKDIISQAKGIDIPKADVSGGGQPPVPPKPTVPADLEDVDINNIRKNLSPEEVESFDEALRIVREDIQKQTGKTLTNKEVIEASAKAEKLKTAYTRSQTKELLASVQNLRDVTNKGIKNMASGDISKEEMDKLLKDLLTLKTYGTDAGRRLQALNTKPQDLTNEEYLLRQAMEDLVKAGKSAEEILDASKNYDLGTQDGLAAFYRQFKKASVWEVIDETRMFNMLSSPGTHITNLFSNFIQGTVIAPGTRIFRGLVDPITSAGKGGRQAYASEGLDYYKGAYNGDSLKEGWDEAMSRWRGDTALGRPDLERLPTRFPGISKLSQKVFRLLDAADGFWSTIIRNGEVEALTERAAKQGKDMTPELANQIQKQADDLAEYYVFRQVIDPKGTKTGQGVVLRGIDSATAALYELRNAEGPVGTLAKFAVPFVQTPVNILKQGIEYSPAGVLTLPGAKDKSEQVAKALLGSTVTLLSASLLSQTDYTWDAPSGETERKEFYDSGRQPYSILINGKWVNYSRLGPLSFPIALAAAWKWEHEKNPKSFNKSELEKISSVFGALAGFWSDQSYLQGLESIMQVVRGEADVEDLTGLFGSQLATNRLVAFVNRIIDPVYRDPQNALDIIKRDWPILSKQVQPYFTTEGEPSTRDYSLFNAFSPLRITENNPEAEGRYQESRGAINIVNQLQGKPPEVVRTYLKGLKERSPSMYSKVVKEVNNRNQGVTTEERKFSGKSTQQKASEIIFKTKSMTPEEVREYLLDLKEKGIYTDAVDKEIKRQLK